MDALDEPASDVEDSQATQMMLDLVPSNLFIKSPSVADRLPKPNVVLPTDLSSDSYNSSRHSNAAAAYQFHGLASTQQTQLIDEEPNEGSQKENIQSAIVEPEPVTSAKFTAVKGGEKAVHALSHSKTRTPNARPIAVASLQSSSTNTSNTRGNAPSAVASTSRSLQNQAPPSPISSQESVHLDPSTEEQSLAANRHFTVPFAEASFRRQSTFGGLQRSSMYGYAMPRAGGPIIAEPQGNVLVESTPTNSENSQDRSGEHLYIEGEGTQLVDNDAQGNDFDSEASSSFGKSLLDGRYRGTPEATQPSTQIATQPMEEDAQITGPSHPSAPSANTYTTFGQSVPQTNTTGPSSLISMVRPENRWRYKQYQSAAPTVPSVQQYIPAPPSLQATQPTPCEETQPTSVEDMPPPRGFPSARSSKATAPFLPPRESEDEMEIIPDSEAQHSSPPKPTRGIRFSSEDEEVKEKPKVTKAPVAKPVKPISQSSNIAVPTSEEDESEEDSDDDYDARPPKKRIVERDLSEDDVPLASKRVGSSRATAKAIDKGKGKAKAEPEQPAKTTRAGTKKKSEPAPPIKQRKARPGRSWENDIVPSSIPGEDVARPLNQQSKGKKKAQKASKPPVASSSKRRLSTSNDSDEEEDPEQDQDQSAEPVDEAEMDVDDETPAPPTKNNKRKRGSTAPTKKVTVKKERKKQTSPPRKMLRSTIASAKKNPNATRVFALWKPDNYYYSGTVFRFQDSVQYVVKFDDGNEAPVTLDQMRLADLRVGDDVLHDKGSAPTDVTNVDKFSRGFVNVSSRKGSVEVALRDIRISNKTILASWQDRMLLKDSIITQLEPKSLKHTQSPSRSSVKPLAQRGNSSNGLLSETAIVIAFSKGAEKECIEEKARVMDAIKATGGTAIEDLTELFSLVGRWEESGKRWVIHKEELQFKSKQPIRRLFLLADDMNHKPKYLTALALGIPCLSTKWLFECVAQNEEKPWAPFLLPAGYSDHLRSRVTQLVDADWGTSQSDLHSITTNPVSIKILKDANVLCIGAQILPQPEGKTIGSNPISAQQATNSIGRAMLCMGAERVEAVLTPDLASLPLDEYDFIVTRSTLEYGQWPEVPRAKLVEWPWMKSCLIANRLFPFPETAVEQYEYSQEA